MKDKIKKGIASLLFIIFGGGVALGATTIDICGTPLFDIRSLDTRVSSQVESSLKADLKSCEINKIRTDFIGKYTDKATRITIDIQSVSRVDGGIEVLARAWKGRDQYGFGKDGSVDIERFRIFNPPILVDDPNGDVVRIYDFEEPSPLTRENQTGFVVVTKKRYLREDPAEAIRQTVAHNALSVGKLNTKIIKGSVGNTVSTFYPSAGSVSPFDGDHYWAESGTGSWATMRDGTTSSYEPRDSTANVSMLWRNLTTGWGRGARNVFLFDVSSIDSGDTTDSATLSLYGTSKTQVGLSGLTGWDGGFNLTTYSPTSNSTLKKADWDLVGNTKLASDITYANWDTSAYNVFTLNTTGESHIDTAIGGDGVVAFANRFVMEIEDVEPDTNASDNYVAQGMYMADQSGTASDPKLVVTHSAGAAPPPASADTGTGFRTWGF